MNIRAFKSTDAEALLTVFRKNVPHAFAEEEVDDYATFLQTNTDPYFVAEHTGQVVGACGFYVTGDEVHICWILADPDCHGMGVGSALMRYNLDAIRQLRVQSVRRIVCRTSQVAYRFFERFGFQLQYTTPDFWAPGLDLYYMTHLPFNTLFSPEDGMARLQQHAAEFATVFTHGTLLVEFYKPDKVDKQQPHDRDEVYVVVAGTGTFVCAGETMPFKPGDLLFVPAGTDHRFEQFSDDFATWVLFYGPVGGENRMNG
ncbi:GNAT family N-acetyltransferase [Fibrisoma montanum]|uniref:GNAT family N-acetyltransferase n=1 Tax=Fibrisoma montanum TaxID=2305895 RepID=A0A418LXJ5_9BACT|nr:GNAT family N-acetyltransferase [Fibrisoma montanum]RIV17948.1 GNAT family N-acetyltransferase [Fibrisoma montanum]